MEKETYMNFEEWIAYQEKAVVKAEEERKRKLKMLTRPTADILAEAAEIEAKLAAKKEVTTKNEYI